MRCMVLQLHIYPRKETALSAWEGMHGEDCFEKETKGGQALKSVLISIQPKWCELIATGKKTLEIRKTRPKLDVPFKVYIYCTLPPIDERFCHGGIQEYANELIRLQSGEIVYDYGMRLCFDPENRPYSQDNFLCRKVIGEFTCNQILFIGRMGVNDNFDYCYESLNIFGNDDIQPYITAIRKSCIGKNELNEYAKDNPCLYGWHISDLKIYDKPMDIREFFRACDKKDYTDCTACNESGNSNCTRLNRPPQSWCYVEEA